MQETTADVRRDIEETRARVSATLAELNDEVTGRRDAVKAKVTDARDSVATAVTQAQATISDFAREHPWYALGAALGLGMLISATGADRAAGRRSLSGARSAATGAKSAAKGAATAAAGVAKSGADKARGLVSRDGAAASGAGVKTAHDPQTGAIGSSAGDIGQAGSGSDGGVFYRLQNGIVEAVGGDVLLEEMRREAQKIPELL